MTFWPIILTGMSRSGEGLSEFPKMTLGVVTRDAGRLINSCILFLAAELDRSHQLAALARRTGASFPVELQ
jgi:hypothetical protein